MVFDLNKAITEGNAVVLHVPWTPRYNRALSLMDKLVNGAIHIGTIDNGLFDLRFEGEISTIRQYEAAFFKLHESQIECGIYFTCEMEYERESIVFVKIFSFYDGRDTSPCIKNIFEAKDLSKKNGYQLGD